LVYGIALFQAAAKGVNEGNGHGRCHKNEGQPGYAICLQKESSGGDGGEKVAGVEKKGEEGERP
jgi:hypothetical protein